MKKVIIYFHGYGSSAMSNKVDTLKEHFPLTYSYDIGADPSVSLNSLSKNIDDLLLSHKYLNDKELSLVFVGTSLGAWYAERLGLMYKAKMVLVNPCFSPSKTLSELGLDKSIADKYDDMSFDGDSIVIIAEDDELIDFSPILDKISNKLIKSKTGGHRFNGEEFNLVINHIKSII
jgi:hypothetical protein